MLQLIFRKDLSDSMSIVDSDRHIRRNILIFEVLREVDMLFGSCGSSVAWMELVRLVAQ